MTAPEYSAILKFMTVTEVEIVPLSADEAREAREAWFVDPNKIVSEFIEVSDFADDPESSESEHYSSSDNNDNRKRSRSPSPGGSLNSHDNVLNGGGQMLIQTDGEAVAKCDASIAADVATRADAIAEAASKRVCDAADMP